MKFQRRRKTSPNQRSRILQQQLWAIHQTKEELHAVAELALMVAEDAVVEQSEAEVDEAVEHLSPMSMVHAARRITSPRSLRLNQALGRLLVPQMHHLGMLPSLLEEMAGARLPLGLHPRLQQLLRRQHLASFPMVSRRAGQGMFSANLSP